MYTNECGEGGPVIETAVYGPLCLTSFLPEDKNASLNSKGAGGMAPTPSRGRKAQYKATFLSHQERQRIIIPKDPTIPVRISKGAEETWPNFSP